MDVQNLAGLFSNIICYASHNKMVLNIKAMDDKLVKLLMKTAEIESLEKFLFIRYSLILCI